MRFSLRVRAVALVLLLHLCRLTRAAGTLKLSLGKHGRGVHVVAPAADTAFAPGGRSGDTKAEKLHIVLTHHSKDTLEDTAKWWDDFISVKAVRDLQPAVYVYCQNPEITDLSRLSRLLRYGGGQLEHLDNIGRESHAYLHHIITHYDRLPRHVLFSQDMPLEWTVWNRFQKMFVPETGFLPLALVGHQPCEHEWLPSSLMQQFFSILTRQICPPEGFTACYNGQFVVSRQRIRRLDRWIYKYLQELLSAPTEHWIHDVHNNTYYKDPRNPFIGHILERSWTLAFDCYETWRAGKCLECEKDKGMLDCGPNACQCFDNKP